MQLTESYSLTETISDKRFSPEQFELAWVLEAPRFYFIDCDDDLRFVNVDSFEYQQEAQKIKTAMYDVLVLGKTQKKILAERAGRNVDISTTKLRELCESLRRQIRPHVGHVQFDQWGENVIRKTRLLAAPWRDSRVVKFSEWGLI